tara:strand:+ start:197 stop:904 length:708 start_codon:yes stop_codon:yes gene_type:complete
MPSSKKSTSIKQKTTRQKKVVKSKSSAAPEETTLTEPVTHAPVKTETVKTETVKTETVNPVTEEKSHQVVEEVSVDQQFKDILLRIQEFRTLSSALTADVRKLQKNVTRQVRESNKKNRKRHVRTDGTKRPPSGFAKPALISDSLCQFLGKPSGTEMARTEVTKYLTQYIKQHALQDQENKRRINCDSALKSLLNVQDNDEVTYFNLQRYMKPHFPTSAANLAAAAAAAAALVQQ